MDLMDLMRMGASMMKDNSDSTTTDLDTDAITSALSGLIRNSEGSLDLASLMTGLSQNGLGAIVGSWLGNGENESISSEQITDLLGADKVSEFASSLGISQESATHALSDSLPKIVDKFTAGEGTIMDEMLGQVGGSQGAMDMLSKMFR